MARRKNGMTPSPAIEVTIFGGAYGTRDPVAPESYTKSASQSNIDWEGLYGAGENTNGFTSTNPNGSQHEQGNGSNQSQYYSENRGNGQRWSPPVNWNAPRRRNRTGE